MATMNLPQLGSGMTDADIVEWLVRPGDRVNVGDPIVVIDTAKVSETIESPFAGVVVKTHPAEGDTVEVGDPLITVDETAAN